jgi:hypothetical protein
MSVLIFWPEGAPPPPPPPVPRDVGPVIPVLELSFEDPGDPPMWIDQSGYLRQFSIKRGRSTELDRTEAGTAAVRLDNRDRRFDPTNAAGPYWPHVVPTRQLRLSVEIDSEEESFTAGVSQMGDGSVLGGGIQRFALYTGYVESWGPNLGQTDQMTVDVTVVDAFKVFGLQDFVWGHRYTGTDTFVCGLPTGNIVPDNGPPFIPDDLSGERIARVLDCVGWTAEDRDIDPGDWIILGSDVVFGGTNNIKVSDTALGHLQAVADVEGGTLFIAADGRVTFRQSSHVPTVDATWGEEDGEKPYHGIGVEYDDVQLWNAIEVAATDSSVMATVTALDVASVARYWERDLSTSVLPAVDAATEAVNSTAARAAALLERYKDPVLRITQMQPSAETGPDWIYVLRRELFDAERVRRRPPGGGLIEQDSRIEGISIVHPAANTWHVNWTLSAL